ncbi:hypothetical protein V5P93_000635 [Actinokineospora auranticolor]|uniref:Uncharacterized protein n=1 Tax=Actinokineospora auranticolor TaxID=155976 RepID=A0A2S6GZ17_9PSEU|nr:hypothetical protein [Actinokineospora auranticolor]PPK70485.1 hypothetical protein CLV40_102400 [Actinokineospora auranticolor]
MNQPVLADQVVDILADLASNTLSGNQKRAADVLFDAVLGRLRRIRLAAAFDVFEADPTAPQPRSTLTTILNDQFARDPSFRDQVSNLAQAAGAAPQPPEEPLPARYSPRVPKRVLMGAGAAVLALALVVGGRALFVELTEEPELDGTTPCRTFWTLKEPEQRGLLVRAYRGKGQERREDEPYIVASVLYACGQSPDSTVNDIIDAAALK